MGSFNTNKILGIVPKREFSVPKWQKCSQNGTSWPHLRVAPNLPQPSIETKMEFGHRVHRTTHSSLGHHYPSPPQDTSHVTCFFKKVDLLYGQPLNILVNYFLAKWFTFYFVIIGIKTLNCLPIPIYFCSLMTSPFSDTPPPPLSPFGHLFGGTPPPPFFVTSFMNGP